MGTVRDRATGEPIAVAEVVAAPFNRRAMTDPDGRFSLAGLPVGQHMLLVRAVGYRPDSIAVAVQDAEVVEVHFRLVPDAVQLDSIAVTARPRFQGPETPLRRFEDRRRMGFGKFVDSTALRALEHHNLASVLVRHGVEVRRFNGFGRNPSGGRCLLVRYLDGFRLPPPSPGDDLRNYSVVALAAVEIYESVSLTPTEFRRPDQSCGVMLMWTRR